MLSMRTFIIILLSFITFETLAQTQSYYDSLNSVFSDSKYLFQKFDQYKKKGGLIPGMKEEITQIPNDSLQQIALIAFYNQAYGYKWVDKKPLTDLIDMVIQNPKSDELKDLAIQVKSKREKGLIGQSLPHINLPNAEGELVSIYDLDTEFIVIDLWATWCAPCLKDMKKIPTLKAKYDFVEFYSISFDKEYEKMVKFQKKKNYKWPIVFAGENHELWDYFEVRALPHYFIVNKEREIIASTVFDLETELEMLKE